jgi:hypothetical protein
MSTNVSIWFALASCATVFGTGWQAVVAAIAGVNSMDRFLSAQNALWREEKRRIQSENPFPHYLRRRRGLRQLKLDMDLVLSDDERKIGRAYDRQAWGWSFLLAGALITAIATCEQVHL